MSDHCGDPMWRLPAATAKRFGVKPETTDGVEYEASDVAVLFNTQADRVILAAMHGEFPPPDGYMEGRRYFWDRANLFRWLARNEENT